MHSIERNVTRAIGDCGPPCPTICTLSSRQHYLTTIMNSIHCRVCQHTIFINSRVYQITTRDRGNRYCSIPLNYLYNARPSTFTVALLCPIFCSHGMTLIIVLCSRSTRDCKVPVPQDDAHVFRVFVIGRVFIKYQTIVNFFPYSGAIHSTRRVIKHVLLVLFYQCSREG